MLLVHTKVRKLLSQLSRIEAKRAAHTHIEHKVRVKDLDINIVQSGKGDKSVLLMPGTLGSSWTDFKPQIEQLPKLLPNHTVIAWDPPGFGKSVPPKRQWNLDIFHSDAQCAVDLMTALGRPKFSIAGWSGGGISGLIAASRYADNVDKLIVWGAGAFLVSSEVNGFQNIRDVRKWSARMREPMEELYGAERFAELWSEWVDILCAFYKERNGDFCKREVSQIQAPTLIIRGKKDPVIAEEPVAYLREHIKDARYLEFPQGKHNLHLRYIEEFNKLVADFILEKC